MVSRLVTVFECDVCGIAFRMTTDDEDRDGPPAGMYLQNVLWAGGHADVYSQRSFICSGCIEEISLRDALRAVCHVE